MEVKVIKDTKLGLYSDLNSKPTVFVFPAKVWGFLWFGLLKPDNLD